MNFYFFLNKDYLKKLRQCWKNMTSVQLEADWLTSYVGSSDGMIGSMLVYYGAGAIQPTAPHTLVELL